MKRSILYLSVVLFAGFFSSCKQSDNGQLNSVTPGGYTSLDQAVYSAAPISRSTSIIVPTGANLVAPNGTLFSFPPNAFETLTGQNVTGSVQVTFNDWLKKGDMVFGKVLPISYGMPLLSGGEAYVQVTQNGQVLRLHPGTFISVHYPQFGATNPSFNGYIGNNLLGSDNTVNWLSVDTNYILPVAAGDTVFARCDTMGYVQIAVPFTSTGNSNFTVTLNAPVTMEQTMAVALYDAGKAIYPLEAATNGVVHAISVPQAPMHLAVMGINSGNFYGGIVAIPTPASDSNYTVILKEIQPMNFRLQLNGL